MDNFTGIAPQPVPREGITNAIETAVHALTEPIVQVIYIPAEGNITWSRISFNCVVSLVDFNLLHPLTLWQEGKASKRNRTRLIVLLQDQPKANEFKLLSLYTFNHDLS